jgi:hypothetical protein
METLSALKCRSRIERGLESPSASPATLLAASGETAIYGLSILLRPFMAERAAINPLETESRHQQQSRRQ